MARSRSLKQRAVLFLATALITASCIFLVGWFTHIRGVAHAAFISVAAIAFLPFTILGIGLALGIGLMMLSAIGAMFGGGADVGGLEIVQPFAEATVDAAPPYYRWLAKHRHPAFWGVAVGLLLGGGALWTVIGTVIVPRELATTDALIVAQQLLDQRFAGTSRYPAPSLDGHLTYASLGDDSRSGPLLDGFGRPIVYEKFGHWKVATYTLRSLGRDGIRGGDDDLCLHGGTKLGKFAQFIRDVRRDSAGKPGVTIRIRALREMQCKDGK